MRALVVSDLHGNIEATGAVLDAARALGYDRALVLGDLVGYGADPAPVVAAVRGLPGLAIVRGNHDKVVADLEPMEAFNDQARAAAGWTRRALGPEAIAWMRGLPRGPIAAAPGVLLSHGSPADEDAYLLHHGEARRAFDHGPFELCFFGHTHLPGVFVLEGDRVEWTPARGDRIDLVLAPGRRCLVNPGSVGQPRDRDPRAAFALYDAAGCRVSILRVPYPVGPARSKILRAGLPPWLGDRLLQGV
jgi:diadenosine tetraphosphatase ApaH/serine/threonine PP2A family protein phosphatase